MSKSKKPDLPPKGVRPDKGSAEANRSVHEPGWAEGLRKLYDNVVAEPLPDHFEALLKKLDQS